MYYCCYEDNIIYGCHIHDDKYCDNVGDLRSSQYTQVVDLKKIN
jgi:hypothetical protein